jgi:hypothetical protein
MGHVAVATLLLFAAALCGSTQMWTTFTSAGQCLLGPGQVCSGGCASANCDTASAGLCFQMQSGQPGRQSSDCLSNQCGANGAGCL